MTKMARFRRGAFGAACIAIAAILSAQTANRGNKEFYQFQSFNAKLVGEGKVRLTVVGSPLKADLRSQRISFTAAKFVGDVVQKKGAMEIVVADITGNVSMTAERPSSQKASEGNQTVRFDTQSVHFDGPAQVATFPGQVTLNRVDKPAAESLTVTASSGSATLYPTGESGRSALKSLRFAGPVTLKAVSSATEDGKAVTHVVHGRADRLDYDDAAGKLTLTGRVAIEGDHPLIFGNITATRVVLTLGPTGEIDEIDIVGDPAVTNLDRKPPPKDGGRRRT